MIFEWKNVEKILKPNMKMELLKSEYYLDLLFNTK